MDDFNKPSPEMQAEASKEQLLSTKEAAIIDEAKRHLDELPESDLRGLTKDFLRRWGIGYLSTCRHPKATNTIPTPRFILRLGDKNDPPSFNAVLTNSGRERFKNSDRWEAQKCLSAGKKFVFNPAALDADNVVVTEGEFDALSIMFATGERIKVCALGGAGQFNDLERRLNQMERRPHVVILFDKDDAGQERAADLLKRLSDAGIVAVIKYLDDFMTDEQKQLVGNKIDANAILTKLDKQALSDLTDKLIDSARADFSNAEESIKLQKLFDEKHRRQKEQPRRENFPADVQDLIDKINTTITDVELEQAGYIRHSERGAKAPDGYCCPWCNSGNGSHKTGALKYITKGEQPYFGCAACGNGGDVISLIAHVKNLPTSGNGFFDTLKAIADEFGISYNPKIFEYEPPHRPAPNMPLQLRLPPDIAFSGNWIVIHTPDKKNTSKTLTAARTLILPTKRFVNDAGGNLRYEVSIRSPIGKWTRAIVSLRTLLEPTKIYELAEFGANVANAKLLASYFSQILAEPENEKIIPTVTIFNRPGWHEKSFIYPMPDDKDSYRVERTGIDYEAIFTARGDKDEWLLKFLTITRNPDDQQAGLKRICTGAALVAPLLEVIKIPNPQFNLWGTSNFAKTPLLKFALSIYGDPSGGALLRTWSATPKNMLTMAAGFNCLPVLVDEGETMSKWTQANLSEYVYNFSIGIIGQANKRNGDVRAAEKFHGVRFSTAERPLHDVTDKRGAFKRMLDIHVTKPLFRDSVARQLHIFCERNHGHFGRQWTRYIEEHADEIVTDFDRMEKHFGEDGFKRDDDRSGLNSVDATNARAVIACAVAYWHFCKCTEIETCFDFAEARDDAAVILAQLPTVDEISDVNRATDLLVSWIVEHPDRFMKPQMLESGKLDPYNDYAASSHLGAVGKKFADGRVAFFANAFRSVCADIGIPSYDKLLSDLYDEGYLDCKNHREKSRVIKACGEKVRAYVLSEKMFDAVVDCR